VFGVLMLLGAAKGGKTRRPPDFCADNI